MNAKRYVAIFLALILVISLLTGTFSTAFAAEAYTIGLQDADKNNKTTVKPGDVVDAYLYLAGNPGILSAGVLVKCPDGVEIIKAVSALNGHNFKPTWQYSKSYAANPYLVWMLAPTGTSSNGLVTYNGNWCKLTFRIDAELAEGDYTIRLSAPKDKNLTAQTSGGVIKPGTNNYVNKIAISNFTITVKAPECDHNWSSWKQTQAATCETKGKQVRVCSVCHTEQEKAIDATGHAYDSWTQTAKPTCTEAGSEKRTCQNNNCGDTQTRSIASLGHKFSAPKIVKEPTCTKEGQKSGKCTRCSENTTENIPATGHNFGKPTVIRQPTAEKPGLKQSKCSRCGEVKEEKIPCIPAETTVATTEETTEATTLPEVTDETETLPSETIPEETLPVSAEPEETMPIAGTPEKAVLKLIMVLAAVLLFGVLVAIIVIASRSKKK